MSQPHHHGPHTPADTWRQLAKLLASERRDVATILAFALGVGLLSVVTPAAIEALVNTVAFGVLLWPVIVLALVTLGFLAFAACLRAMQSAVAEYVQRRVFVRTARAFVTAFLRCDADTLARSNPTDIVNRFFEVAAVQKCVATLLVDGVQIAMTTIVGLAVLAFYHPYLLVFAVVMVFLLASPREGHVLVERADTAVGKERMAAVGMVAAPPRQPDPPAVRASASLRRLALCTPTSPAIPSAAATMLPGSGTATAATRNPIVAVATSPTLNWPTRAEL
jgi:ABC-type multidrug transport system fused ATPase/permease subunit